CAIVHLRFQRSNEKLITGIIHDKQQDDQEERDELWQFKGKTNRVGTLHLMPIRLNPQPVVIENERRIFRQSASRFGFDDCCKQEKIKSQRAGRLFERKVHLALREKRDEQPDERHSK